ncbi:MAG TPA: outer membrane lipoprotein carrier protein LolA, partial [Xanthobacteraceae bacterium]|nr:outer membrane lipoprotein carrier protein LolA [Xanthobacteraceae bacterium]
MRAASLTVIVGALAWSFAASAPAATAQSVPLPHPAPQPKAAPVGSPFDEVLRPPGAIPNAPEATAAPAASSASTTARAAPSAPPAPRTAAASPPAAAPMPAAKPAVAAPARAGETTAFDASQRALIDRVSNYLSSVQTMVGDFVQVGPDGARTEGQFYLQKPGRVRFEYNPPSPIDVIADGQSVVVRDRKLATQDLYPLSQTPLRFLLADRINLLKDTNLVSVSADDVFVTVVIEEKQALVGTHRLMLMFSAKDFQLKQWTVTDPQGYDTTVAVYNLDTTKKPDPS